MLDILNTNRALLVVAVPLLASIVIDLTFTQPRLETVQRLGARRAELLEEITALSDRALQSKRLAAFYRVDDLSDLMTADAVEDPLTYVASMIDAARLTQIELTAGVVETSGSFRRTRFTIRLLGSYARTVDFVRMLEEGRRLATIDAFIVERSDAERVENRLNISIFDRFAGEAM